MRSCHVTVVRRPGKRSWCHLAPSHWSRRQGNSGRGASVRSITCGALNCGSDPPPHALNVLLIRRPKLAAHLGFFKGDMNPVENGEDRDRRNEHWPSADPDGNAQSYGNEAEIHRIAAKPVR